MLSIRKKITQSIAGFSLIELIMVLGLLGILSVSAIPAITNSQAVYLDGASRKLEADLRYAQNLATTTGDSYGLRTTAAGADGITGYEVYNVATDTVVDSPYDHLPMTEDLSGDFKGISISGASNITFDEVGTPTYVTGNGTMTMANGDGNTKDVIVSTTGLINIQ